MHPPTRLTFLILTTAILLPLSRPDPRISEAGLFCGPTPSSPNTTYNSTLFTAAMELIWQQVSTNGHGNSAVHSSNASVYTLAQCHVDLSRDDCLQCYAATRTRLPRCVPVTSGRLFLDGCFLRYDGYDFFNESVDAVWDRTNCNSTSAGVTVGSGFAASVGAMINEVTETAVASGGYAVRGSRGVFGLAQCWHSVSREGCRACLDKANREIRGCLPSMEGRALYAGCYLRYSTRRFFDNDSEGGNRNFGATLGLALSVVAFLMLSLFAGYVAYRWRKRKQARNNPGHLSYLYNKYNLKFKYETLEKATNYFDISQKVGQGGAGSVYRGKLPNGKTVAVKRLFFGTRQWVDEFFNEVNLITGIEHKNLVKLLGGSISGPECLLVYEFMPNKSLDHYLFDKNKVKILNWKERYNIIVGTAKGIAFLHGGLETRIIHRDIKTSNVLLDENFEAKLADFGLARCYAADKTHLSTGIAGTLGYMAPEYLVKGQLTEKADVYSYGVLVLEIVCARKNNAFMDSGSLLQTVWELFKMSRLTVAVDPCLKGDFPEMEVAKVLQIGLLCAQASVAHRPSMLEVVQMLTDENYEIPEPKQPPFINNEALVRPTLLGHPYSINGSRSNAVGKHEASYSSTEFLSIQSSEGQSTSEEPMLKVVNQ